MAGTWFCNNHLLRQPPVAPPPPGYGAAAGAVAWTFPWCGPGPASNCTDPSHGLPHSVCDMCIQHGNYFKDTQPGRTQLMTLYREIESPRQTPGGWQIGAEMATGVLDVTRVFPIGGFPGFKTRMCSGCEDIVEAYHWFLTIPGAGGVAPPALNAHEWRNIPAVGPPGPLSHLDSCSCEFIMDSHPVAPPVRRARLCQAHNAAKWDELMNKRDVADKSLRRAKHLNKSGTMGVATNETFYERVRNGTYRACPCGRDVVDKNTPLPPARVWSCMGCQGFLTMRAPMQPTMPLNRPGFPPMTKDKFLIAHSRWRKNLRLIGNITTVAKGVNGL